MIKPEIPIGFSKDYQLGKLQAKKDLYTQKEMEDCFAAGVKFARNMLENPSNSEYMVIVNKSRAALNETSQTTP